SREARPGLDRGARRSMRSRPREAVDRRVGDRPRPSLPPPLERRPRGVRTRTSMIDPREGVRVRLERPVDRMIADRLRKAGRGTWLALRTPFLLLAGSFRHRERRPPAPSRVHRLLVLRTDRLGDMALTTPALADLRAHFRKAEVTVLAPPGPLELLRH